jgi:hypothetical protein
MRRGLGIFRGMGVLLRLIRMFAGGVWGERMGVLWRRTEGPGYGCGREWEFRYGLGGRIFMK